MQAGLWSFNVDGTTINLDGKYFGGAREMYCRRVYFQGRPMTLHPDDTVIDLGANMGLFTLLAATRCRRVVAVEAQAGFAREIESLLASKGLASKAHVENVLVGGATGLFSRREELESASHFGGVVAPSMKMSELLAKHHIDRVDFLKCDIEGSEFDLIRGGEPWLDRVQRIAMEVHVGSGDPLRVAESLRQAGFTVELRDSDLRLQTGLTRDGYLYAWRGPGAAAS
jgi:FkbM family methyltransferase